MGIKYVKNFTKQTQTIACVWLPAPTKPTLPKSPTIHPADPKIKRRDLGSVIRATFSVRLFASSSKIDGWNSFSGPRVAQPCEWKGMAKSQRSRGGLEEFLLGDGERIPRDTIGAVLAEEVFMALTGESCSIKQGTVKMKVGMDSIKNHVQSNKANTNNEVCFRMLQRVQRSINLRHLVEQ
jgi:hypothetical protein